MLISPLSALLDAVERADKSVGGAELTLGILTYAKESILKQRIVKSGNEIVDK